MWFAVLPDGQAARTAARLLGERAGRLIAHGSGRPWLLGRWPDDQVVVAEAGRARLAVIGRCPVTAGELSAMLGGMESVEGVERIARRLAGSFHLVASIGGRVRVRGSASGVRRVFHARLDGATVGAGRCDVLAAAIDAPVDERVLAARLLTPGALPMVEESSAWRGVTAVPPDHCLLLEPDGGASTGRWWQVPEPAVSLADGALAVREALSAAVDSCTVGGGTVSADLSGGLDSTSLCFLASRGRAALVTNHHRGTDPHNDDAGWAGQAAAALPDARHLTVSRERTPMWFAGLNGAPTGLEDPGAWPRNPARLNDVTGRMTAAGSRLHLTGSGGDEVFRLSPRHLHDLVRDHPLRALPRIRAHRLHHRQPLWSLLRALGERGTYRGWLTRAAEDLAAGGQAPRWPSMSWGPAPAMPPWTTSAGVETARALLREAAATRPEPFATRRAQHIAVQYARTAGAGVRWLGQAARRAGLPQAAPCLDDNVLDAALSVRMEDRERPGRYKPLLTAAMEGIVPAPLLTRTTKGDYSADFYASLHRHRGELLEFFGDSLLAGRGLIDAGALRAALLAPHPTPHILSPLLQTLACEAWLRAQPASCP
ncbi:asparagine synthase-related protein [Streptomyces hoynatensis]|uniref:Asparagine synthetase B family protein n=1 Tax=Streptomyces hoynatensis TaxID=1141874 RepID=A0A3A9Z9V6_9ACTN|nr:asparagine synthase-related protein [Streptomyces hoynatensis]RKN45043.1 asparagine synthetase B family protein [Streptomyces hoynatensis]